jgi:hypothetical protein
MWAAIGLPTLLSPYYPPYKWLPTVVVAGAVFTRVVEVA